MSQDVAVASHGPGGGQPANPGHDGRGRIPLAPRRAGQDKGPSDGRVPRAQVRRALAVELSTAADPAAVDRPRQPLREQLVALDRQLCHRFGR
eukprot:12567119-Alexandrium_andersonii.AAC.1